MPGRKIFLENVWALLPQSGTVLEFGAGRGRVSTKTDTTTEQDLRGPGRMVIGVDPDPIVLTNTTLDKAYVCAPGHPLPVPNESVDFVYSHAVFEHVANAEQTARELTRIIKPGGWLCAYTPHRWSHVAFVARLVPNRLHSKVLRFMNPKISREDNDVFPTVYAMNTRDDLNRLFPEFDDFSFTHSGPPAHYVQRFPFLSSIVKLWCALVSDTNLIVIKQKRRANP